MSSVQIEVKVINKSSNELPKYETKGAAGLDLRASEGQSVDPGKRCLVHTGLYVSIPEGYELQIRPRSGLALKKGITVLNSPGTIDSDYRGEICVILMNHGDESVVINEGDKIAQAVLCPVSQLNWIEVTELDSTERGEGGFGHTGI